MKKLLMTLVVVTTAMFAFAFADNEYDCINYSGQSYIGAVVLESDGTAIGCNEPQLGDEDLIPAASWMDWVTLFQGQHGVEFVTRLGRACDDCYMGSDGNGGDLPVPLGFEINYFGQMFTGLFVNSNGSVSFGEGSSNYDYPLNEILGDSPGVCAYCIDLENNDQIDDVTFGGYRGSGRHADFYYWGRTQYSGNTAFAVTWINMPTFSSSDGDGTWNTFQIMFVDVDETTDVDIIINYGSMRNEADEGYCELEGEEECHQVAIGLGTYDQELEATVYNSLVDDDDVQLDGRDASELWDEGDFALNTLHLNSDVPGRFVFQMRDGELPGTIIDAGPGCTAPTAVNYDSEASEDDGSCYFFPTNFVGTGLVGGEIELSWQAPEIDEIEWEYYYITYEPDGELEIIVSGDLTEYVLEGLIPGQEYEVRICAAYDIGEETVGACHVAILVTTIAQSGGNPSSVGGGGGGGGGTDNEEDDDEQDQQDEEDNQQDETENQNEQDDNEQEETQTFDDETQSAYEFALEHGITTIDALEEAMPFEPLYRRDAAKMVVEFIESVGGSEIVHDECVFSDVAGIESALLDYIIMSCRLGFMGLRADGSVAATFRPNDTLSRAEFGALLSRMLWGNTYNSPNADDPDWYVAHLKALQDAEIMNQIDNPDDVELRSYAWIIFQRLYDLYDQLTGDPVDSLEEGDTNALNQFLTNVFIEG